MRTKSNETSVIRAEQAQRRAADMMQGVASTRRLAFNPARYGLTREENTIASDLLCSAATNDLVAIVDGRVDVQRMSRAVLAARGLNTSGVWVGFDRALRASGLSERSDLARSTANVGRIPKR